jgi:prepilin signal peptidase PulO-like enzyme (type II secretory pathway)
LGFIAVYYFVGPSPVSLVAGLVVFSALLVTFVADLKYELVSDAAIAFVFGGSVCIHVTHAGFQASLPYLFAGLGAMVPFLLLWGFSRGKWMGFGDVELAFVLGCLLGFPTILYGLYIAFLTGALVGVILLVGGKKHLKSHVPFGPFLIGGTGVALVFANQIAVLVKGYLW